MVFVGLYLVFGSCELVLEKTADRGDREVMYVRHRPKVRKVGDGSLLVNRAL